MNCPKCAAPVDETALKTPSRGEAAKAVLLDYRIWLLAFAAMAFAGIVSGALGLSSRGPTAGGGAALGIVVALMLGRARNCPSCGKTFIRPS